MQVEPCQRNQRDERDKREGITHAKEEQDDGCRAGDCHRMQANLPIQRDDRHECDANEHGPLLRQQ